MIEFFENCKRDEKSQSTTNCSSKDFLIWNMFEYLFLVIFLVEIILKIIAYKWKGFWEDPWNRYSIVGCLQCQELLFDNKLAHARVFSSKLSHVRSPSLEKELVKNSIRHGYCIGSQEIPYVRLVSSLDTCFLPSDAR